MTQFSLTTSNENHLAKSHQKAANILDGNRGKINMGLSSKSFYGNSTNFRNFPTNYKVIDTAVLKDAPACSTKPLPSSPSWRRYKPRFGKECLERRLLIKKPEQPTKLDIQYRKFSLSRLKSQSMPPAQEKKSSTFRASLTSPPRKVSRISSLLQDSRAKRSLTFGTSQEEMPASEDFSPDESNKENCDVDIRSILETLDQEMKSETDESEPTEESNKTRLPPKQQMLPQEIGFPNPPGSNRCWMNATLQTLLGMEPFVEELEHSVWRDERTGQSALLRSFFEVVKHRRKGRRLNLFSALRHLSHSLGALDSVFTNGRQQDATEFLVRLLDMFREEFTASKVKDSCTLRELQLENLPANGPVQRMMTANTQTNNASQNPVCDNVEFRLKETYICSSCSESTVKSQEHLALYLDIPPTSHSRPSLQEALARYMQPDIRELKCSKCSGQRSKVETAFAKLPRFLLVQVKRYAIQTAIAEKLTSMLRVPISLSVQKCVTSDVVMPTPWQPERSFREEDMVEEDEEKEVEETTKQGQEEDEETLELERAIRLSLQEQRLQDSDSLLGDGDISLGEMEMECDRTDFSYRLVCIIMHQGLSPNCGHYVADVYNLEQHKWYHYDDEEVTQPTEEEVVGRSRQRNGYVFCYMHRPLFDQLAEQASHS